jgi:gamma-glutamyl hercynylcysteine S-oxide synthase
MNFHWKPLADGEREFGGCDGLLIWIHNPRFGIDQRNHFDCFRDLPVGLAALKKLSQQLHERGVKTVRSRSHRLQRNRWTGG